MIEERTVYVIIRGHYSDKEVVAVFDEEDLAKAYVHRYDHARWSHQQCEYYPYTLNEHREVLETGLRAYVITLTKERAPYVDVPGREDERKDTTGWWAPHSLGDGTRTQYWKFFIEARDADEAIKIAGERKAQMIAEAEGIA